MGAESDERHLRTRVLAAGRGHRRSSVRFGRALLAFACSAVFLAAAGYALYIGPLPETKSIQH